jgi:hypothetical protein
MRVWMREDRGLPAGRLPVLAPVLELEVNQLRPRRQLVTMEPVPTWTMTRFVPPICQVLLQLELLGQKGSSGRGPLPFALG